MKKMFIGILLVVTALMSSSAFANCSDVNGISRPDLRGYEACRADSNGQVRLWSIYLGNETVVLVLADKMVVGVH